MQDSCGHLTKHLPPGTRLFAPFPAIFRRHRASLWCRSSVPCPRPGGVTAVVALLVFAPMTYAAPMPDVQVSATNPYQSYITEASLRFTIPPSWIRAVMQVESAGHAAAVSPKGAIGLMQVMPKTWSDLRVQLHLGNDPFDPHDNILAGAAFLRQMLDRFGPSGFLAAYNAGPKAFGDNLAGRRVLAGETKRYLAALAPLLPDLPISSMADGGRTVKDWRSAALFAGTVIAQSPLNLGTLDQSKQPPSTAHHFALAPQSTGLFVATASAGQW